MGHPTQPPSMTYLRNLLDAGLDAVGWPRAAPLGSVRTGVPAGRVRTEPTGAVTPGGGHAGGRSRPAGSHAGGAACPPGRPSLRGVDPPGEQQTVPVAYAVPLSTRFRGITVREGVVWRGAAGWAEFAPFADYGDLAALAWWRSAVEAADIGWPAPVRGRVPVNCTVPAVSPEQARALVLAGHGCRTAKVKVAEPGQPLSDDLARVEAVRDALGATGAVRVDANGGWSVDEAVTALRLLDRAAGGLEYAEQPCASVEELAAVRRRVQVPVAADESIRRADDPYRVRALDAADIAVLKVAPLGGVRACLEVAERIELPVVVSSALDTSVGLAAGLALAAALPDLPYACGLGTASLLRRDLTSEPLLPADGELTVRPVEVDRDLLVAARADRPVAARWAARLDAMRALAAGTMTGQDRRS